MSNRDTFLSILIVLALFSLAFVRPSIPVIEYRDFHNEVTQQLSEVIAEPKISNPIYFFGDIMLARDVERTMLRNGIDYPFAGFVIPRNSYTIANFESAVPSNHIPTPNNTFRFSSPKTSLQALVNAGFTHVGLANNHTFDFGLPGYNQTVASVWDSGLIPFGHPSVLSTPSYTIIENKEAKIGILAIHTLYGTPSVQTITNVLTELSSKSDIQIAYLHWGDEYVNKPNLSQRSLAKLLTELGVDIIIGHHPHVVQSIELINDVPVFYSLGNFIFDQYFSIDVQQGMVLKLTLDEETLIEIIPVTSLNARNQPSEMDSLSRAAFLEYLAKISSIELREDILKGRLIIDSKLASSSEVVIMTQ